VALSDWNLFDRLDSEERIANYLRAALLDIEEGECNASFILDALADAAKARAINQLAKEMGIDRKRFYDIEGSGASYQAPEISHDAIVKIVEAFAAPVLV
jgi:probable addiction module antidote protein